MTQVAEVILGEIATPLGRLGVALTTHGVGRLTFASEPFARCESWARRWYPDASIVADAAQLARVEDELNRYFAGDLRVFSVPVDLRGTPFQIAVWHGLQLIPYGETRSYAQMAADIGRRRSVRAVGAANGANPVPIIVACHRVIGSDGKLVGYGGGLDLKERLLALEHSAAPIRVAM
ncbi:MAG: methylated-DNA--[protein]-cysteine S-methyltransferase [Anaerolineae bacterium]